MPLYRGWIDALFLCPKFMGIAPEDIHVYSIDEVFIDLTHYLSSSGLNAREFAKRMIQDVLETTGITATAGIGTNMYLAKVAMDIVAKHIPADENGVRIPFFTYSAGQLHHRHCEEAVWHSSSALCMEQNIRLSGLS